MEKLLSILDESIWIVKPDENKDVGDKSVPSLDCPL
jgi:hypothetical protein